MNVDRNAEGETQRPGLETSDVEIIEEGHPHAINTGGNQGNNPSQRMGTAVRRRHKGMMHVKKEKVKQLRDYLIQLVEEDTERLLEKIKASPGFTSIGKRTLLVGKPAIISEAEKRSRKNLRLLNAVFIKLFSIRSNRKRRVSKCSNNATPLPVEQPFSNPVP